MKQAKFSLTDSQVSFLEEYQSYGFKDKSELVRSALERYRESLILQELERSAQLYAELYEGDEEAQTWVDAASRDWPND